MKKIKKLMATLLAVTLIAGFSLTVFAEEGTKTMNELGTKSVPIEVGYTAPTDAENNDIIAGIGGEGDDGDEYNIQIAYDNLSFQYTTTSIKWDSASSQYIVTTEADPNPSRGIQVTNNSTRKEISVTPTFIDNTTIEGVTYEIELKNADSGSVVSTVSDTGVKNESGNIDFIGGAWGKNTVNYTVNVKDIKFGPKVETFTKEFAAVSLTFADAPHTGGGAN